jgi:hypothetical protein
MPCAALLALLLATADPAALPSTEPAPPPGSAGDAAAPAPQRPTSLMAADSLRGGSAATAWAGFAAVGASYAQGLSLRDDLGASLDFDWSSTELVMGGFWRRALGKAGTFDVGLRLLAGWYADFGATWMHDGNESDRGLQLAPALTFSTAAGSGLVALSAEAPFTATFWRGGGFLFAPKVAVGYETPLYGEMTLGLRGSVFWRGGGGGAPMRGGRVEPELLVVLGYRVF